MWIILEFAFVLCFFVGIPFAVLVAIKDSNRRRKSLLSLDGVVRDRLEAKGFVLCVDRCDEHATSWCIRIRDNNPDFGTIDPPPKPPSDDYHIVMRDISKILSGAWADSSDLPMCIEICRRIPKDEDVLCHILLKCKH